MARARWKKRDADVEERINEEKKTMGEFTVRLIHVPSGEFGEIQYCHDIGERLMFAVFNFAK